MKIYLVGGAVRDKLLGLPVKEKDWVVVGSSPEEMLAQGFRSVGKDFPVFLHPETNEEYALARTERKVGRGYTGFTFDTSAHVTLEEDLQRRDLTINAMAETLEGHLIDPYGGRQDLAKKILRHVSPAFVEDPVRILRVARFKARFGFDMAPETMVLMKEMVQAGEVDALVPERVWKELERALSEKNPEEFFNVLAGCGALSKLFPQITELGIKSLAKTASLESDPQVRFAALLHDIPEKDIKTLCANYRVPNDYRDLALQSSQAKSADLVDNGRKELINNAERILTYLENSDAFRRGARFEKILQVHNIIISESFKQVLQECYQAANSIDTNELINAGYVNAELGKKIKEKRLEAIKKVIKKTSV